MSQPIRAKARGRCTDSVIGRAQPAKGGGGSPGSGGRCASLWSRPGAAVA